jgi:hypothetical protein
MARWPKKSNSILKMVAMFIKSSKILTGRDDVYETKDIL